MTPEDLKVFLAAVIPEIMKGVGGEHRGAKEEFYGGRRTLEEKMFNRLDKFAGEEKLYKEWEYNLRVILKSANPRFELFLDIVEKFGEQVSEETPMLLRANVNKAIGEDPDFEDGDGKLWEKVGPELFSQLSSDHWRGESAGARSAQAGWVCRPETPSGTLQRPQPGADVTKVIGHHSSE